MILTGHAGAVSVAGVNFPDMGEYTLTIPQEVDTFRTLDEPFEQGVGVFKEWSLEAKLETKVPARDYGVVSCADWPGVFLKEWDAEIAAMTSEAPIQQDVWKTFVVDGFNWKVTSGKFVDSTSKHVFLAALIGQDAAVQVTTPVLIGDSWYGEAGTDGKPAPKEETLEFTGSGVITVGAYFDTLVNVLLGYRTELLAASGVAEDPVTVTGVGSGNGFLSKLGFKSDGKRLTIDASVQGSGEFVQAA